MSVLNNVGFCVANVSEHVVVEVEASVVYSTSRLTLRTHSEHWFELLDLVHHVGRIYEIFTKLGKFDCVFLHFKLGNEIVPKNFLCRLFLL